MKIQFQREVTYSLIFAGMLMGMGKRGQPLFSEFDPPISSNAGDTPGPDDQEKDDSEVEEDFESLINQIEDLNEDKYSEEKKVSMNSCNYCHFL